MAEGSTEMSNVNIRDFKPSDSVILSIDNVSRLYKDDENEVLALSDINLEVKKGEFISIIGASGCGKTTLLNCLSCLLDFEGKIDIDGVNGKKKANKVS